jgi:phosphotriesterase-related protein
MVSRRSFLQSSLILTGGAMLGEKPDFQNEKDVMTVNGPIPATQIGTSLIHEHILVDFIGAEKYDPKKWDHDEVIKKVLPYLHELKQTGCNTMVECTPAYLGRDALLLQKLSTLSGLRIITNTGYYGGSANKFLPAHAFTETERQLAGRWTKEYKQGIEGSGIRPGFIKISVNDSHLSEISKKLIRAAALCHLATGLTIASHTGPAIPALEEIDIIKSLGVAPDAFIWVHAQNEKDPEQYIVAARAGAWVSLDGVRDENVDQYAELLSFMKKQKFLHRVLVSHDAGWYEPDKPDGGKIRGYTTLFKNLIPTLKRNGFTQQDVAKLMQENPSKAFAISIRKV